MRADLDTLLPDAGREPNAPLDTESLWTRGRRRRALRQVSAAGGGLAGIAALALVASSLVGGGPGDAVPEIAPMAPPTDTAPEQQKGDDESTDETTEAADETPTPSTLSDERTAAEQQRLAESRHPLDRTDDSPEAGAEESSAGDPADDGSTAATTTDPQPEPSGPTPDWSVTADPCALHDADQMRAFIDVASPVDGQQIDERGIALVGCSSVYEATVRYRITQGSTVIVDDFVTATAGGPELGEFRQWIDLTTTGTHTLEVFWDSPKDGEGERDKTTLNFDVN